jgi:hypothetical protein
MAMVVLDQYPSRDKRRAEMCIELPSHPRKDNVPDPQWWPELLDRLDAQQLARMNARLHRVAGLTVFHRGAELKLFDATLPNDVRHCPSPVAPLRSWLV